MANSKMVPGVPAKWFHYIKGTARNYACGVFSAEDAEQVGLEAFLKAKAHYVPAKGAFDRYAKVAIRNALLNERIAEQRNRDLPANPNDDGDKEIEMPPWAAEGKVLGAIDEADKARAVSAWADKLPANLSLAYHGLYCGELSQRQLAAKAGVTQAAVSQRNQRLLKIAEKALARLAEE